MTHRWDDARQGLLESGGSVVRKAQSVWSGFIDFAARDNVLEVAVGLMIASAFTAVANSLVSDVILPPLSLLPFADHKNLPDKFITLRAGPHRPEGGYNTLHQAADDGAVTLAYGRFIDKSISFIGLGLVLYTIATLYGYLTHDNIIKEKVKCAYCRKEVSKKAKRCFMCTSWLDGREDRESSAL
ncbi:ion channel [Trametes maxima]|nr:ion channel [Trametes maxima]